MNPFEIYIVYLSWGTGGKSRPVLVIISGNSSVAVYPITTQYSAKSKAVQANYFELQDWNQEGLSKKSYVDTGTLITLPPSALANKTPIGVLTANDKQRLLAFLNKTSQHSIFI